MNGISGNKTGLRYPNGTETIGYYNAENTHIDQYCNALARYPKCTKSNTLEDLQKPAFCGLLSPLCDRWFDMKRREGAIARSVEW